MKRYILGFFMTLPLAAALWLMFGLVASLLGWHVMRHPLHGAMLVALPVCWLAAVGMLVLLEMAGRAPRKEPTK